MKRVKRRYLALQLNSNTVISQKELLDAIWGSITKLYGEYGASLTNLSLINYNPENKRAIIRTNLTAVDIVRNSITLITSITNSHATVHVVAISGTIKALCQKLETSCH